MNRHVCITILLHVVVATCLGQVHPSKVVDLRNLELPLSLLESTDIFDSPFVIDMNDEKGVVISKIVPPRNNAASRKTLAEITFDDRTEFRELTIKAGVASKGNAQKQNGCVYGICSFVFNRKGWKA